MIAISCSLASRSAQRYRQVAMRCPYCGTIENRVVDSRLSQGGEVTRRRRECEQCMRRYTTYERIGQVMPWIVKNDGRRQPYDRNKLMAGLWRACVKRRISTQTLERVLDQVEHTLIENAEQEVPSSELGEQMLLVLRDLDPVAYIRFASVYRDFQNAGQFLDELSRLKDDLDRRPT